MTHPLRCRCGTLQGELLRPGKTLRAVCYCIDCRTYAHALSEDARTLDEHGGTEVVATQARYVRFSAGAGSLACISLTGRGLLRWYASCCRTPVANTPRDMRLPYAGVMHTCLGTVQERSAAFGPVRMRVNTRQAAGAIAPPRFGQSAALLRIGPGLVWSRLSGSWRDTPFFDTANQRPRAEPRVLDAAQLQAARNTAMGR
jgi:hypothetical protein